MVRNSKYQIGQVIHRFLPALEQSSTLSGHQRSILKLMRICKTVALGGHKERCDACLHSKIHYNSCGNRHCPSCQGVKKEKWMLDRQQELLPVKYFHCVFTVPSELYDYFRYNKKVLYNLLFKSVKETLLCFGHDPKHGIHGEIGAILVLHSWTQQLTFHPHVHCIVPAGGLQANEWRHSKGKGKFLFPVIAMSRLFRGKLLAGIHQLRKQGLLQLPEKSDRIYRSTKNKLYQKDWVVYAKKAFGGPRQVLAYLSSYTHKICISNYRILHVSDTHVTFRYTDRKKNKRRVKTIRGEKFLQLFAEHILPKRFVKMRYIGFLSPRFKKIKLAKIRSSLNVPAPEPLPKMTTREILIATTGKDPYLCPVCGIGEMHIVKIFPPIRGSPKYNNQRYKNRQMKSKSMVS